MGAAALQKSGNSELESFLYGRASLQDKLELPDIEETPKRCLVGCQMKDQWPGGDVMNQSLWRKYNRDLSMSSTYHWPPEEKHYKGARLGEYARPLVINRNVVGYMNQAPVPPSLAEDELTLTAQASSAAKRAMEAAVKSASDADKARQFFVLALMKMKALFRDPPVNVRPTADVFPLYSASVPEPALVAVSLGIPNVDAAGAEAGEEEETISDVGAEEPQGGEVQMPPVPALGSRRGVRRERLAAFLASAGEK